MASGAARPDLADVRSGAELVRWYWRRDELIELARMRGVRTSGGKELLTRRLAAALDGLAFTEPAPRTPGAVGRQLSGPLSGSTLIPRGQRCSQPVRAWFVAQVGPTFRFDAAMRDFFAACDGTRSLADALDHYRATRDDAPAPIGAQFEFNRFTSRWHAAHPSGSRAEALAAWRAHRSLPVDERDPPSA